MNDGIVDYAAMGRRISRLRQEKHWTQEMLAEKAHISLSFLGHIERGTRIASLESIVRISTALESDIGDIVDGKQMDEQEHDVRNRRIVIRYVGAWLHSLSEEDGAAETLF